MALLGSPKFWIGVTVGVAAITLRPRNTESIGRVLRPIFKALIKGAIKSSERGRDLAAFMREVAEDASAEAHAELRVGRPSGATATIRGDDGNPPSPSKKGVGSA
jgi:hypothetical protein